MLHRLHLGALLGPVAPAARLPKTHQRKPNRRTHQRPLRHGAKAHKALQSDLLHFLHLLGAVDYNFADCLLVARVTNLKRQP